MTFLIATSGWRASFVATGGLGIVWAVFWVLLYRDLAQSKPNAAELAYIKQEGVPTTQSSEVLVLDRPLSVPNDLGHDARLGPDPVWWTV